MKLIVACAVTASALVGINKPASAGVIYQTSFEQPEFQPGLIDGQGNWIWEGKIDTGVTHSGNQALHIDGRDEAYQTPSYLFSSPATGIYTIDAYYLRTGDNREIGGLLAEGDTGFIAQIQTDGSGAFYLGNTNGMTATSTFAPDVWHDLTLVLDFNTYQVSGFVDGSGLGSLAINNTVKPSALNMVEFFAQDDQANTVHDAWIDDLTISQVAGVPEPASWAMMILGMGAIGFAIRRRKITTRVSYVA